MPPNFQTGLINNAQRPPTPAQLDSIRRSVVTPAAILHSGGLVALGTDSPVSAPALGQHMTIRAFTYGPGVTNHEVLQSVTINAAKLSNAAHELGTVEPGKIADLVMIRGNPLESVDNLTNVEMVMKNGVIYTIADILRPYEVQ
jgi:imidazolonepropionase-like amidohydrolase